MSLDDLELTLSHVLLGQLLVAMVRLGVGVKVITPADPESSDVEQLCKG